MAGHAGRNDEETGSAGGASRFDGLGATVWSKLKGPDGFRYLHQHYGAAIRNLVTGRLARGDFPPLNVNNHADDAYNSLLIHLHHTGWLEKYPDPMKGRFRPYLYEKVARHLIDMRRKARGERRRTPLSLDGDDVREPSVEDPVYRDFVEGCLAADVHGCLWEVGLEDPSSEALLRMHLEVPKPARDVMARRMGQTLDQYRRALTRARTAFKEAWLRRGGLPGEAPGFGEDDGDRGTPGGLPAS